MGNNRNYSKNATARNGKSGRGKKYNKNMKSPRDMKGRTSDYEETLEQNADQRISRSGNDITFWNRNKELFEAANNVVFSYPAGYHESIPCVHFANSSSNNGNFSFNTPGLCIGVVSPTIGTAATPSSPLNIATTELFAQTRKANSGSTNYDAVDEMIYILSLASCYSCIVHLQRAYMVAENWDPQDYYTPRYLLRAMGFNAADIFNHRADFLYGINLLITKLSKYAAPGGFQIFRRWAFMYRDLYREGTSIKDQMYMFVPRYFYEFALDGDSAGSLVPKAWYHPAGLDEDGATVDMALQYATDLINSFLQVQTFRIMSGDIEKAFSDLIYMQPFSGKDILTPIFDIQVLEQFKNATAIPLNLESLAIVQSDDKGYLVSSPLLDMSVRTVSNTTIPSYSLNAFQRKLDAYQFPKVLTTTTRDVTRELVCENSRLMATFTSATVSTKSATVAGTLTCGSEVIDCVYLLTRSEVSGKDDLSAYVVYDYAYILTLLNNNATVMPPFNKQYPNYAGASGASTIQSHTNFDHTTSTFDFAPLYLQTLSGSSLTSYEESGFASIYSNTPYQLIGDVDNYAIVDTRVLARLHESAVFSLFTL